MMTRLVWALLGLFLGAVAAVAQEPVWVQIEARPSLVQAQDRARAYAARLPDVNGFDLGSGWYGIALGPYTRGDADIVLRQFRREGVIPADSFIAFGSGFRRQFWPVGSSLLTAVPIPTPTPVPTSPTATPEAVVAVPEALPAPLPEPDPLKVPDETRREALASERLLSRPEREALQVALQWAGFYTAAIDGAFGRGTRNAMAAWQDANRHEPTGVLTTRQRAELFEQYNAVLEGMVLTAVTSAETGIEMLLPLGVVGFDRLEPPFAHYEPTTDLGARVLLISQSGDQATLTGLYDIMQTLEIVPRDGPRERSARAFTLIGQDDEIVSHTEASLQDGQIKGFTLIWPAGDEARRIRVLAEMQVSFTRRAGVLDPAAGAPSEQSIDLVAGLQIRRPKLSRSGFYIDAAGAVVTTTEVIEGCGRITLDTDTEAEVAAVNKALGIAILRPVAAIAPMGKATLQRAVPRLQSEVAVAGYSYGGVLGAPTLTFGTLADLRGLGGETDLKRLALAPLPGDAGGPVLDAGGAVLGMLLPKSRSAQQLPGEVSFAADGAAITELLEEAGIDYAATEQIGRIPPEDLTDLAGEMTILVSCWN